MNYILKSKRISSIVSRLKNDIILTTKFHTLGDNGEKWEELVNQLKIKKDVEFDKSDIINGKIIIRCDLKFNKV